MSCNRVLPRTEPQYSVLQTNKSGSFKNCSLKGSLENQKWFFYGIKILFITFIFKSVTTNFQTTFLYKEAFVHWKVTMDVKSSSYNHQWPYMLIIYLYIHELQRPKSMHNIYHVQKWHYI